MAGIVERLEVGSQRTDCLRLTKYNPDYKGAPEQTNIANEPGMSLYVTRDFSEPFNMHDGSPINIHLERQVVDAIIASGDGGITYTVRTYIDTADFSIFAKPSTGRTSEL
jgi:hypothetical protein